jgi:hypothetical protein
MLACAAIADWVTAATAGAPVLSPIEPVPSETDVLGRSTEV